jgi:hypothetical protein
VLTFKEPGGSTITETVLTGANGFFSYAFTPREAEEWSVVAEWPGDENHEGSSSPLLSFTIEEAQPWWQERWHLIAATIAACAALALALKVRAKRKLWYSSSKANV